MVAALPRLSATAGVELPGSRILFGRERRGRVAGSTDRAPGGEVELIRPAVIPTRRGGPIVVSRFAEAQLLPLLVWSDAVSTFFNSDCRAVPRVSEWLDSASFGKARFDRRYFDLESINLKAQRLCPIDAVTDLVASLHLECSEPVDRNLL